MKAKRVWGLVLAAAMCMAVAGCGQKEAETASTEPQYQVIGTEAEGAYDILLKNSIDRYFCENFRGRRISCQYAGK